MDLTMRICSFVFSTTVDFKSNSQDVIEIQSFSLIEGFNKNIAVSRNVNGQTHFTHEHNSFAVNDDLKYWNPRTFTAALPPVICMSMPKCGLCHVTQRMCYAYRLFSQVRICSLILNSVLTGQSLIGNKKTKKTLEKSRICCWIPTAVQVQQRRAEAPLRSLPKAHAGQRSTEMDMGEHRQNLCPGALLAPPSTVGQFFTSWF